MVGQRLRKPIEFLRNRRAKRASHLSRYPMETVARIDRPTTLILDDEVSRVPKRAAFFQRALHGDLGEKSKRERARFSFKTPLSYSLLQVIRSLVPHQNGAVAEQTAPELNDPARKPMPTATCRRSPWSCGRGWAN